MKKILIVLSYIVMITTNALANILPINGENTGVISDSYPNLFAPAGYTFSIWGVIYILLGILVFYLVRQKTIDKDTERVKALSNISTWFILSSFANAVWILTWHYRMIGISVVIMLIILVSLILMMREVIKTSLLKSDIVWMKPPIGVYFGWITVATVANITTFLVSIQWDGFGISEEIWMIGILIVSALIACAAMLWSRCGAYGLVIIWAYIGIWSKHTSETGFDRQYGGVLITLYVTLAIIILVTGFVMKEQIRRKI